MARQTKEQAGRRKSLAAIAARFASFRPAREVLSVVRAVPTIFVQVDHATRVGGWPTHRVGVIHGPSNEGKSLYALGLLKSFLARGHLALFVDAERTTSITWAREVMGADADADLFFAKRPDTYEKAVDAVREFVKTVADLRREGAVAPETTAIVVVDSIRKLVPEDILKKITKEGADGAKGSVDGMGGRAAQIRAAMNAAWMDELIPLMDDTGTAIVFIAREAEDPDADFWAKKFGNDYKVGGGKSLIYDSSIVARIQRAAWVVDERGGEKRVVGERHRVTIRKTKVGGKEDRQSVAYFHSSNGVLIPSGFDRARDVLELGERLGVIKQSGGRLSWRGSGTDTTHAWKARSAHEAVAFFAGEPRDEADDRRDVLAAIEAEVREAFDGASPTEHDDDGVVP